PGTANASAAMWRRVGRAKREAALETVCVAGLIGGAFVVWDARIAVPAQHIALWAGDLFHFFLPSYSFEAERLRALALPFWNPYQAAGVPFLATLNPGALYPPSRSAAPSGRRAPAASPGRSPSPRRSPCPRSTFRPSSKPANVVAK